jgi:hypothetical protein
VAITVYGRVVSIESTGPPELDLPPEAPAPPEAPEAPPPPGAAQLPAAMAMRAMRDDMPAYYRARAMAPVLPDRPTAQESQQEYGIATGGAVATQTQGAMERENAPKRVSAREGVEDEEPKLWVHIHILLDAPHVGELQVNAPESQVGGLLVVDGRARVMVSSN